MILPYRSRVLTSNGFVTAGELIDREVLVWDGEQYSPRVFRQGKRMFCYNMIGCRGFDTCVSMEDSRVLTAPQNVHCNLKTKWEYLKQMDLESEIFISSPIIAPGGSIMPYSPYPSGYAFGKRVGYSHRKKKLFGKPLVGNTMFVNDCEAELLSGLGAIIHRNRRDGDYCHGWILNHQISPYFLPLSSNIEDTMWWLCGLIDAVYSKKEIPIQSERVSKLVQLVLFRMGYASAIQRRRVIDYTIDPQSLTSHILEIPNTLIQSIKSCGGEFFNRSVTSSIVGSSTTCAVRMNIWKMKPYRNTMCAEVDGPVCSDGYLLS